MKETERAVGDIQNNLYTYICATHIQRQIK